MFIQVLVKNVPTNPGLPYIGLSFRASNCKTKRKLARANGPQIHGYRYIHPLGDNNTSRNGLVTPPAQEGLISPVGKMRSPELEFTPSRFDRYGDPTRVIDPYEMGGCAARTRTGVMHRCELVCTTVAEWCALRIGLVSTTVADIPFFALWFMRKLKFDSSILKWTSVSTHLTH